MAYKIVFTADGQKHYDRCLDYLFYELESWQAAINFRNDVSDTIKKLALGAGSYAICEDKDLMARKIRKIHLRKHKYKIFYRIVNEHEVHIDAILHDKQDFKNILN